MSARRNPLPSAVAVAAALAGVAAVNALVARASSRRHPPRGSFVEIEGMRIHYLEKGVGSPIVLIHGNGVSAEDFVLSGLFDRLAEKHRVIAFDRPGFGHTSRPRGKVWTAKAQADVLRRAANQLGIARPVLVGHSWGTLVAMTMGLNEPQGLAGLVLMSGYYRPTPRLDAPLLSAPAIPLLGDLIRYTISPLVGWLIAPLVFKQIFSPAKVAEHFKKGFPLSMALRPSQIRATAADTALMVPEAARMRRREGELRLPLLIIAGRGDKIVSSRFQSERLAKDVRGSDLRLLDGAGHMIHHIAPSEVGDAIMAFVDQESGAAVTPAWANTASAKVAIASL